MTEETDLKRDIISAVEQLPHVAFVRNNIVGAAKVRGAQYVSMGHKSDLDIYGMTKDGVHFEIEVKVPGEEKANLKRLEEQKERVDFIRRNAGISGIANSVEQAVYLLGHTTRFLEVYY